MANDKVTKKVSQSIVKEGKKLIGRIISKKIPKSSGLTREIEIDILGKLNKSG